MKKIFLNYLFQWKENNLFHTPQSLEMLLTEAISTGNIPMLQSIMSRTPEGELGILSHDKDRQVRYLFVTASAVFSRAAMRGGMNYELACSMADAFCQAMDQIPHIDTPIDLIKKMALDFCQAIRDAKNIQYSPLINDCCVYIYNQTHKSITLEDLANFCGMSTRRLSLRFRKETGIAVGDYIHQSKMNEAKLLLRYTDHSVCEIASFLGYCNQSHFSQIFKKLENKTPIQYRNQNQTE